MIKLSVIIVHYNVSFFLEQCLLSVQAACKNISSEIIVVDNNSNDDSCLMIKERFPSVRLVENKENIGFSKANNQGVTFAEGEYVLILNPDTVIGEEVIEEVLLFSDSKKKIGAIGVQFIDGTGNFLPECKRNLPTVEIASRKLMGDSKKYYAGHIAEKDIAEVHVLTGAFMLIKREIYLGVEGFDEDYFMFGEDIDLSYKLLNQGLQNYYFGKSTIIHYKGESTIKDKTYLKNFYGAMEIFYKKHFTTSFANKWILKNALKALVLFKSKKVIKDKILISKTKNFLFLSKDSNKYERLKQKLDPLKVERSLEMPKELSPYGKIIFDNSLFTFKEIIKNFELLKEESISLRIIPKNTFFFIGSDSSKERGEVFKF